MERESQGFTVATLTTLVLLSLVGTLTLGVGLRWALAGVPLLPGGFVELRHAHSHLGYYGVLFPLMWWAWRRLGQRAPGLPLLGLYAVGVVMSAVGFAREGYGRPAIIGSTIVRTRGSRSRSLRLSRCVSLRSIRIFAATSFGW